MNILSGTIRSFYERIIQDDSIDTILSKYPTPSEKGLVFEALWDLVFKTGCVENFLNSKYTHMIGNVNNAILNPLEDMGGIQKYLSLKMNRGNSSGISDITLYDKEHGTYIFISSKFYSRDIDKTVFDYDIQDIVAMVQLNKNIYKNFMIYIVVHDKIEVKKKMHNANKSSEYITRMVGDRILDITDLEKALQKLKLKNLDDFTLEKDNLTLKFHQEFMISKTMGLIEQEEKNILWGWKCRSGKTFGTGGLILKLKLVEKYKRINCLIITPAPTETLHQFVEELFEKYNEFNLFNIVSKSNSNIVDENKDNIVIVSKQSLQEEKHSNIFGGIKFDLIVFDENHSGGTTELSERIIKRYSDVNTIKLYLTATYMRPSVKWDIKDGCKLIWDIIDEQLCKTRNIDSLILRHNPGGNTLFGVEITDEQLSTYDSMPDLHLLTTMFQADKYDQIKSFSSSKYGFSPETLFSLNKKQSEFNFPAEVGLFLRYISGSRKEIDFPSGDEYVFGRIRSLCESKSRTLLSNSHFTTQLWFLPFGRGQEIDKVSKCLKKHMELDDVLKKFSIFIINSKTEYKVYDLKGEIKKQEEIAKDKGKWGLILLSGNQCSLGITLNLCDIVFLLNNTLSADRIMQMMYRCMTEGPNKKMGFVFDPHVSRVLQTTIEYTSRDMKKSVQEKLQYVINNHLINIDMDFVLKDKEDTLIKKIMEVWRNNPLNHLKMMMKSLSEEYISLDNLDQTEINSLFDSMCFTPTNIKFEDEDGQEIKSGKEISKISNDEVEEEKDDDSQSDQSVDINFSCDVLPFIVPLSCILTMTNKSMDFLEMLKDIKQYPELIEIFNDQTSIWWKKNNIIDTITNIVEKYISKDSITFNMASIFKDRLVSLIDEPQQLLELVNEYLRPKEKEKKEFGEVFTPIPLITEMLDRLPVEVWSNPALKWFDPASGMGNFFIVVYQRLMVGLKDMIEDFEERKKHILEKMLYASELNKKNVFIYRLLFNIKGEYRLNVFNGDTLKELDTMKEWGVDKFDVIVGNPPYNAFQLSTGKRGGGDHLWNKFVVKSLLLVKDDGLLCLIHPPGWRKPQSEHSKCNDFFNCLTRDNTMLYLEIHNTKDGMKTFCCGTRYDWYVLRHTKNNIINFKTKVVDEEKNICFVDLSVLNWLPNGCFKEVGSLLAVDNEENCQILQSMSVYETRKKWISPIETKEFKYPVVHSTPKEGHRFVWSNKNDNGFYGVKKVIFGESGIYNPIIDIEGKYAMSQGAMAIIINNKLEGEKISKFLCSKEFDKILNACLWSSFRIDWRLFSDFKKKFYEVYDVEEIDVQEEVEVVDEDLTIKNLKQLKEMAKGLKIKGYSGLKKDILISKIKFHSNTSEVIEEVDEIVVENYSEFTMKKLKEIAKKLKIKRYSIFKSPDKQQIISLIKTTILRL